MVNEVAGYHEQMQPEVFHVVPDRAPCFDLEPIAEVQIGQVRHSRDQVFLPAGQRSNAALAPETNFVPKRTGERLTRVVRSAQDSGIELPPATRRRAAWHGGAMV